MDLTVVCVLWVGRYSVERTFNGEWVRRLRSMVERNLTMPHRFVCLSNVHIDGVERIPLTEGWPAWWAKIGFGVTVGGAGMLGDLAESLIKRDCQRKDASQVVPGFGGVLDVVDAVLFAAPVAYAWLGVQ